MKTMMKTDRVSWINHL